MKNLYFTIIVVLSSMSVSSQTLSNTTWTVYDSNNSIISYFNFSSDTLFQSSDNDSYNELSTFQENGNHFTIIDLPSSSNCPSDTGKYVFQIQNDTLKFTLISDLCFGRPAFFSNNHWIKLLTRVQNINLSPSIKIYPNPANDVISIKSEVEVQNSVYIVFDYLGRQVLNGNLTGKITMVDINRLAMGIYFLQIGEKSKQLIKVIKK